MGVDGCLDFDQYMSHELQRDRSFGKRNGRVCEIALGESSELWGTKWRDRRRLTLASIGV